MGRDSTVLLCFSETGKSPTFPAKENVFVKCIDFG
jgi:hypothetical protein